MERERATYTHSHVICEITHSTYNVYMYVIQYIYIYIFIHMYSNIFTVLVRVMYVYIRSSLICVSTWYCTPNDIHRQRRVLWASSAKTMLERVYAVLNGSRVVLKRPWYVCSLAFRNIPHDFDQRRSLILKLPRLLSRVFDVLDSSHQVIDLTIFIGIPPVNLIQTDASLLSTMWNPLRTANTISSIVFALLAHSTLHWRWISLRAQCHVLTYSQVYIYKYKYIYI